MGRQLPKGNHQAKKMTHGGDAIQGISPWSSTSKPSNLSSQTTTNLRPVEIQQAGPLSKWLGKLSIRLIVTVPFLLQLTAAVAIVGYLSFRNGQQAVGVLLNRLQAEISDRVSYQLHDYLQMPHHVTRMNQRAYELGFLDVEDLDRLEQYFHQQMKQTPSLSYVNFGHVDGRFVGVGRQDDGRLYAEQMAATQPRQLRRHDLDDQGDRLPSNTTETIAIDSYEPRDDIWYTAAVEAGQPLWTDIYQWPDQPDIYSISASYPLYADPSDPTTLVGVLGADFILSQVNQFLVELRKNLSAHTFIVERATGMLIASSTSSPMFIDANGEPQQLSAVMSPDPLIREAAQFLQQQDGGWAAMTGSQDLDVKLEGDRQYIRVLPWQDDWGLDWLIVVVVPESNFMAQINRNTRTTLLLCALALAIAIWVGIRTAQWITQPILFLNDAAKNLAAGAWNQQFILQRSDEVGELAQSFNNMARQLRHSFRSLESQKDSFARFFPSEYLTFLDKTAVTDVRLGDHVSREMTVMFSDIRGFTSMSESMSPQETFDFVNTYLEEVSPAVRLHNGVIVKFLGDGTMAVFPDSANSAVNAGIDTFECLRAYNQRRTRNGLPPIHLGIGIHVGYMMVGIVGERNRMQADALSDTVNLTARLEGLTKFYGVSLIVSEPVVKNLSRPTQYQLRFLGEAIVKGRTEPIGIYEVMDVDKDAVRLLKTKTLEQFEAGVDHYRNGRFTQAQACFEHVLAAYPEDQPAIRFLEQIHHYLEVGKPEQWDGVWRLTAK